MLEFLPEAEFDTHLSSSLHVLSNKKTHQISDCFSLAVHPPKTHLFEKSKMPKY